jgi:hypothetical protein
MKKMLESLINKQYKEELTLLFGENSYFKIVNVNWSTNAKNYVIHTKLIVNDIEKSVNAYPSGADYIISESIKLIGLQNDPIVINSIDYEDVKYPLLSKDPPHQNL